MSVIADFNGNSELQIRGFLVNSHKSNWGNICKMNYGTFGYLEQVT